MGLVGVGSVAKCRGHADKGWLHTSAAPLASRRFKGSPTLHLALKVHTNKSRPPEVPRPSTSCRVTTRDPRFQLPTCDWLPVLSVFMHSPLGIPACDDLPRLQRQQEPLTHNLNREQASAHVLSSKPETLFPRSNIIRDE